MQAISTITDWTDSGFNWLHRPTVNQLLSNLSRPVCATALEHALTLHPNDGFLNGHYGRVCLQNEKPKQAIKYLSQAVKTQVNDASLHYTLGIAYNQLGDNEKALPYIKQAVEIGANTDHVMMLIRIACDSAQFEAALGACEVGLSRHPDDERFKCAYPQTLSLSGKPDEALQWLQDNDTGDSSAMAQLAYRINTQLNRADNARAAQQEYQRRLLRSQPNYRTDALAVLNNLPDTAAKLALAEHWERNLTALADSDIIDTPITLAMSILVRDEADVIEHNIRYHAAMGVSHFVVTDNGSKDGTREILEKLTNQFSLIIIDEPSHTIDQDLWVTRMATKIKEKGGFDWIIHNDADEFWHPNNGHSLPLAINDALRFSGAMRDEVGVLCCKRFNMIGTVENTRKPDYRFYDNVHLVKKDVPLMPGEEKWNYGNANTVARLIMDKVMTRTDGLSTIEYGNHGATHDLQNEQCDSVKIFHFPVRTYEQFERKVKNYGESLEKNTRFDKSSSGHLRYWYKRFLDGKLREDYESIVFDNERLTQLEQEQYVEQALEISTFFTQ